MSIMGSKIGKDNELCYLSFKNKKQKVLDKRFKGYGGQSELVCNLVITICYVQICFQTNDNQSNT